MPFVARFALPVVLLGLPSIGKAQTPKAFAGAWNDEAARYRDRVTNGGIVGSSLWFIEAGRPIRREYFGFADLETQRRVDENTIYHWASITKTFTAIAIMQLRDRGLLTLDDPIVRWVPELRAVHDTFASIDRVTIGHLLSHSAGFRGGTWPWGGDKSWHPHEPTEWTQLVAMLPYTEILFEPGSRYSYSNPGIIFLGRVIETISGDDFEVYVDKNILRPLGMTRSYFDVTPYHLLKDRSNNYTIVNGRPVANGLDFDTGITTSNGGLNAPITDMAKYLAFLMGDAPTAEAAAVAKRSTLEEMWQAVLPISKDGIGSTTDDGSGTWQESIGLSYFVYDGRGMHIIGHTGSQKSFLSFFYVDPVARTAAIAAFNTVGEGNGPPDTRALLNATRADIFDRILPLYHAR
jgi:CubicO group peptidase (beta-lactamase class C family)